MPIKIIKARVDTYNDLMFYLNPDEHIIVYGHGMIELYQYIFDRTVNNYQLLKTFNDYSAALEWLAKRKEETI